MRKSRKSIIGHFFLSLSPPPFFRFLSLPQELRLLIYHFPVFSMVPSLWCPWKKETYNTITRRTVHACSCKSPKNENVTSTTISSRKAEPNRNLILEPVVPSLIRSFVHSFLVPPFLPCPQLPHQSLFCSPPPPFSPLAISLYSSSQLSLSPALARFCKKRSPSIAYRNYPTTTHRHHYRHPINISSDLHCSPPFKHPDKSAITTAITITHRTPFPAPNKFFSRKKFVKKEKRGKPLYTPRLVLYQASVLPSQPIPYSDKERESKKVIVRMAGTTVAILSPGEMGSGIACLLKAHQFRVITSISGRR